MSDKKNSENRAYPGIFVVIEGLDGVGKSSCVDVVVQELMDQLPGRAAKVTREPGGTPQAERLRPVFKSQNWSDRASALIAFAMREEHMEQVIRPALAQGDIVVTDRFTLSTYAYQGGANFENGKMIAALEDLVTQDMKPDLVLYFHAPAEVSYRRRQDRAEQKLDPAAKTTERDRFDEGSQVFFKQAERNYLSALELLPARTDIIKIDTSASELEVQADVRQRVSAWAIQKKAKIALMASVVDHNKTKVRRAP